MKDLTRRGFLATTGVTAAGVALLPATAAAAAVSPGDVAGRLTKLCAPQIKAIRDHPWIKGAASDQLKDIQIGSWATQDLLWGGWIGPAYTIGFTGAPAAALAALAWLKGNSASETAYLQRTSKGFRNAPGASQIWPGFLGYGAYGALTAQNEQAATPAGGVHAQALTVVWAAEFAYHQAWRVVLDASPRQEWARFGAGNWGGPGFTGMVKDLSAGLNAAVAASSTPLATIEQIARQVFMWEYRAWTDSFTCQGWTFGS